MLCCRCRERKDSELNRVPDPCYKDIVPPIIAYAFFQYFDREIPVHTIAIRQARILSRTRLPTHGIVKSLGVGEVGHIRGRDMVGGDRRTCHTADNAISGAVYEVCRVRPRRHNGDG